MIEFTETPSESEAHMNAYDAMPCLNGKFPLRVNWFFCDPTAVTICVDIYDNDSDSSETHQEIQRFEGKDFPNMTFAGPLDEGTAH